MLRRIGFRGLLPVVNLVLCAALVCTGNSTKRNPSAISPSVAEEPTRLKVAFGLNLPAIVPAVLIQKAAPQLNEKSVIWLAIPFSIVLWFLVGFWLDRRLGLSHRAKPRRSFIRDWGLVAGFVIAILALVLLMQVMHTAALHAGSRDLGWMEYSIFGWYALFPCTLAGMCWDRFFQSNRQ